MPAPRSLTKGQMKVYHAIGEVAQMLGEDKSTILYWEKEFPHLTPHKTPGGTRQYKQRDIEALRAVQYLLRERKLTISGARAELKRKRSPLELRENTIARLEVCLDKLKVLHHEIVSRIPKPQQ